MSHSLVAGHRSGSWVHFFHNKKSGHVLVASTFQKAGRYHWKELKKHLIPDFGSKTRCSNVSDIAGMTFKSSDEIWLIHLYSPCSSGLKIKFCCTSLYRKLHIEVSDFQNGWSYTVMHYIVIVYCTELYYVCLAHLSPPSPTLTLRVRCNGPATVSLVGSGCWWTLLASPGVVIQLHWWLWLPSQTEFGDATFSQVEGCTDSCDRLFLEREKTRQYWYISEVVCHSGVI